MARAAVKRLTRKPTKARTSRKVAKAVETAAYGNEPIDISGMNITRVFNWYNYMYDEDETRPWLFDYLKRAQYNRADVAAVRRCPKTKISRTYATVARIINNGNEIPESMFTRFEQHIKELIELGKKQDPVDEEQISPKIELTIRQRIELKIKQAITECEAAIDADRDFNVYDWLIANQITPPVAQGLREYYQGWVEDFRYIDAYATRAEKKHYQQEEKRWMIFVGDIDRFLNNKRSTKVRKSRTKKTASAADQVKGLKYQSQFPSLKIVSINPADIVGCKQLWVYNTKTRKLTRYDAIGPQGIQVKRTTLIGFDPEKSSTKSVRKPEQVVHNVLTAGKVSLRKLLDELKTNETKPTGRINTDTVLLRVIK